MCTQKNWRNAGKGNREKTHLGPSIEKTKRSKPRNEWWAYKSCNWGLVKKRENVPQCWWWEKQETKPILNSESTRCLNVEMGRPIVNRTFQRVGETKKERDWGWREWESKKGFVVKVLTFEVCYEVEYPKRQFLLHKPLKYAVGTCVCLLNAGLHIVHHFTSSTQSVTW